MYYRSMPYFEVEPYIHTPAARVKKSHPRRFWPLLTAALVLTPSAALMTVAGLALLDLLRHLV
jgi:hypothetical protein